MSSRSIRVSACSAPSIVRVRLSCPSLEDYRARLASHHAVHGIFIPSGRSRPRPVGSRLQLKIELGDRSLAYAGGALVVATADSLGRPGLILNLEEHEAGRARRGAMAALDVPGSVEATTPAVASAPRWEWPSDQIFAELVEPEPADAAGLEEVEAELIEPDPAATAGREGGEVHLVGPGAPGGRCAVPAPVEARPAVGLMLSALPELAAQPERMPPLPNALRAVIPAPHSVRARTARRPGRTLVAVLAAAVVVPCLAGGAAVLHLQRRRAAAAEAAFSQLIGLADDRMLAGRLVLPRGDSALDHLLAARARGPDDGRASGRLELLADTFEALGARALARGDLEEGAAHLRAVLRADPRRDRARAALDGVESRRGPPGPARLQAAGEAWGASR